MPEGKIEQDKGGLDNVHVRGEGAVSKEFRVDPIENITCEQNLNMRKTRRHKMMLMVDSSSVVEGGQIWDIIGR